MIPQMGSDYVMPSFKDRADIIRTEFDVRAPKLRLSIFAYLVEAGIRPGDITDSEAFMELLAHVTEYVAADVSDYADAIELFEKDADVTDISLLDDLGEGENPYGPKQGGYQ